MTCHHPGAKEMPLSINHHCIQGKGREEGAFAFSEGRKINSGNEGRMRRKEKGTAKQNKKYEMVGLKRRGGRGFVRWGVEEERRANENGRGRGKRWEGKMSRDRRG